MIWGRFALSLMGEIAVRTSIAGFSVIALGTIAITAIGLLAMPLRLFGRPAIKPFYLIAAFGALSGLLNGAYVALVIFLVTWCYFVACALLLVRAFEQHGRKVVLRCLLWAFLLPLGSQALSVALGAPKVGPDGSLSYIGTYGHESVFTLVTMAATLGVVLNPWRRPRTGFLGLGIMIVSLLLANYRTMIIAAAPLFIAPIVQVIKPGRHALGRVAVLVVVLIVVIPEIAPRLVGDRFDEIGTLSSGETDLLKPPEDFTAREKDVLSARAYIWSSYFYGSARTEPVQRLIGHGPDSRAPELTVHAHNEFLRILFEFGLLGLLLWLAVFALQIVKVLDVDPPHLRLALLAGYASLFLGAMGTAYFNRPEGMIFLAILCASTWYYSSPRQP